MVYARFASLRAGLRRKEDTLFCVFTARLKPCPDTCMVDGCGMAVQADRVGVPVLSERNLRKKREGVRSSAFRPAGRRVGRFDGLELKVGEVSDLHGIFERLKDVFSALDAI